jgi:hypothetical protein
MLRPSDAIEMVHRCRERSIEVLGVDGFILTAATTQPTLEHSIDLSGSRKAAKHRRRLGKSRKVHCRAIRN